MMLRLAFWYLPVTRICIVRVEGSIIDAATLVPVVHWV